MTGKEQRPLQADQKSLKAVPDTSQRAKGGQGGSQTTQNVKKAVEIVNKIKKDKS